MVIGATGEPFLRADSGRGARRPASPLQAPGAAGAIDGEV